MQDKAETCAIIGAGISGLVCAFNLIKNKIIEPQYICIFDEGAYPGGKIQSAYFASEPNLSLNLGPGRFSSSLHLEMLSLMKFFNIELNEFSFKRNVFYSSFDSNFVEYIIKKLKSFCAFNVQINKSFSEIVQKMFNEQVLHYLCDISGYAALKNPSLSLEGRLAILSQHPESVISNSLKWEVPSSGFKKIIEYLFHFLIKCGVQFVFEYALTEVKKESSFLLFFASKKRNNIFSAKQVIFSIPLDSLVKIETPWNDKFSLLHNQSCTVPLYKCFMKYNQPWWNQCNVSNALIVSKNNLQKIYCNDSDKYMFFYADSEHAVFWNTLNLNPQLNFNNILMKQLKEVFNFDIPCPVEKIDKFWEKGISFWDVLKDPVISNRLFLILDQNCYMISDLFTDFNGWCEGSLVSVKSLISYLLNDLDGRCT